VLVNRPNGPNVYDGVAKDYTGKNCTVENFYKVLSGKSTSTGGKTLRSGPKDNIFIYYSDHGAPGLSGFPNYGQIIATELNNAIKEMHEAKMYNKMLIYWEACEGGSMFSSGLLPPDINVLAETATNPKTSSWSCYYDQREGTTLGDEFSVRWMEDTDKLGDLSQETIDEQFKKVHKQTKRSSTQIYGDASLKGHSLSDFLGDKVTDAIKFKQLPCNFITIASDVPILQYQELAKSAKTKEEADLHLKSLSELINDRSIMMETMFDILRPFPQEWITTNDVDTNEMSQQVMENCYYPLVNAFDAKCYRIGCNNFALRAIRYFTDLCVNGVNVQEAVSRMDQVCDKNLHDIKCNIE